MKVLVIMGSPRKGNTFQACEALREQMQQYLPVEFEYLWIKDADLLPCRGCFVCFLRGEENCPNRDDAPEIEQKMHEADGVVFASPVYGMNVTGQMKNFIDRFCYIFHRPRFFDKKAFLLTTTGALGHKDVLKYLDGVARMWGFEVAGQAALINPPGMLSARQAEKKRAAIDRGARDFAAALQRKQRRSPGFMDVIAFRAQRAAFAQLKDVFACDYEYWKKQGWLSPGAKYYVDVPVNPLYSFIGSIVERVVAWNMRKELAGEKAEGE